MCRRNNKKKRKAFKSIQSEIFRWDRTPSTFSRMNFCGFKRAIILKISFVMLKMKNGSNHKTIFEPPGAQLTYSETVRKKKITLENLKNKIVKIMSVYMPPGSLNEAHLRGHNSLKICRVLGYDILHVRKHFSSVPMVFLFIKFFYNK